MKYSSIDHFPQEIQEELNFLVSEVLKRIPQTEFIILYGSYAKNKYVRRDLRIEDNIPTYKVSDYDILVLTSGIDIKKVDNTLDNIEDYFFAGKNFNKHTPVQFINDDIKRFNKFIEEGRYFYTDEIKKDGIILYNSGNYKLSRRRKLNFDEIQEQAQEYFDEKFKRANNFLKGAKFYCLETDYKEASFLLHQACENYYYAIRLTFTLRSSKQHNLSKLIASVKRFSEELENVFPQNTPEEKKLFKLLKASYVDARYSPSFVVTKDDIERIIPQVELLRDITERICRERIEEYGERK